MNLNRAVIRANDLRLVAPVESFHDPHEPMLSIGNRVRLNSGGLDMLIVDVSGENLTVAYRDKIGIVHERTLPSVCVHRIRE